MMSVRKPSNFLSRFRLGMPYCTGKTLQFPTLHRVTFSTAFHKEHLVNTKCLEDNQRRFDIENDGR